jgi:hypothetical protein
VPGRYSQAAPHDRDTPVWQQSLAVPEYAHPAISHCFAQNGQTPDFSDKIWNPFLETLDKAGMWTEPVVIKSGDGRLEAGTQEECSRRSLCLSWAVAKPMPNFHMRGVNYRSYLIQQPVKADTLQNRCGILVDYATLVGANYPPAPIDQFQIISIDINGSLDCLFKDIENPDSHETDYSHRKKNPTNTYDKPKLIYNAANAALKR